MSVRQKLILLHTGFAAFAVCATAATIYGVQLHVRAAKVSLARLVDESNVVEHLRVDGRRQVLRLAEIVDGRREVTADYLADRDAFFTQLGDAGRFSGPALNSLNGNDVVALAESMRSAFQNCLAQVEASEIQDARRVLRDTIEEDLAEALDTRLRIVKRQLDAARRPPVDQVMSTTTQLLGLAVLTGIACAVFLGVGTRMVRRWLIAPITDLQRAAQEFGSGNLSHRVTVQSGDELAALGSALNEMAGSLERSRTKYESLFENLRDGLILCDGDGRVVECRDSDTGILGVAAETIVGRRLTDVGWLGRSVRMDWAAMLEGVARDGSHVRLSDMELCRAGREARYVDITAYPVEFGAVRHVAVLLRDVSERHRLHRLSRRAEAINASETFARGIAHDFKDLLHSAMTTMSILESEATEEQSRRRFRTAAGAVRQAANLARKLTEFATCDTGRPEMIHLSETVELVLGAMDEGFLDPLTVTKDLDPRVTVRIDRDQLTQILLNLIRNAGEAMPGGGGLHVATRIEQAVDPLRGLAPSPFAVLMVGDTGEGMTAEVKERLFEPLFSTKPRGPEGARGMGLAVVYAAVRNANGFIQVDSELGVGTTFKIYLPPSDAGAPRWSLAKEDAAAVGRTPDGAAPVLNR